MVSVNKVILIGNVGKDPEIKTFQNGGQVANFSLATSESWKDKSTGEWKKSTEWHNISVSGASAAWVEKNVHKGGIVYVEGKINTKKYTSKDGVEKTSYTIQASAVQSFEKKKDAAKEDGYVDAGHGLSAPVPMLDDSDTIPF